jgi:hypothetical protein
MPTGLLRHFSDDRLNSFGCATFTINERQALPERPRKNERGKRREFGSRPIRRQFNTELWDRDTALDIGIHRPKMGARQGDAPEDRRLHLERGDGGCGFTPQPPITAHADE